MIRSRARWLVVLAGCGQASAPPPPARVDPPPAVDHAAPRDAAIADAAASDAGTDSAPSSDDGAEWLDFEREAIGGLRLGAPASEAIRRAGKPSARTPASLEGATGSYTSAWTFKGGVSIGMAGDQSRGPFSVRSIEISASAASTWKTTKGIAIGSSLADVKAAYGRYLTPPSKDGPPTAWLVGSVYGGLQLTIERDRVTGMFLGAMAF